MQCRHGEHVVDSHFNALHQRICLVHPRGYDDNLASVHHSANADSECHGWHLGDVVVEEPAIGYDGFVGQGLDTGT